MKVALTRVGIDTGCGGILSPLLSPDGAFEFIPIPGRNPAGRTYGDTVGRHGRALIEYFPPESVLRERMASRTWNASPEWETFTYSDPCRPKASLRDLERGDLLVFYAGLEGWGWESPPALYIVGYFSVLEARRAAEFTPRELHKLFRQSADYKGYWRFLGALGKWAKRLVLVKGSPESKLLGKATKISMVSENGAGRPLHVLPPEMQAIFGDFDGKIAIQRSPTRWVVPEFVERAAEFVKLLE